jgi:hypothetical protein
LARLGSLEESASGDSSLDDETIERPQPVI